MIYFFLYMLLRFHSPDSTFLPLMVNYGLISGTIGGLSTALGLRSLTPIPPLTMLGLTLGWAVSFALAFLAAWLMLGQNPSLLWVATLIGMALGGFLGGFLTGSVVRQVIPGARRRVWKLAIGWSLGLLMGNGIVLAVMIAAFRMPNLGVLVWSWLGAFLGGATVGAIGSRTIIQ
jgi:hypothetical protein